MSEGIKTLRILNLEDDPLDTELIQTNLAEGGIDCEITRAHTREDFLAALEEGNFDLVLSDYSLPEFDGILALEITREIHPETPFIFVSGAIGEERAIESLKNGATDYVLKQRLERLVPAVRRAVREVEEREERRQAEEAMRGVREAERNRIARDLHDGVLQDLSYALQAMEVTKLNAQGTGIEGELQEEVNAIRSAVQALRAAVHDLRLADELDQPFPRLLESLVERSSEMAHAQRIELDVKEGFPGTPLGQTGTQLLRIMQEALTNARRHSGARNILVSLRVEGEELLAEVADDGRGFGPGTSPGVGLRSMRERAASLGGELQVHSEPGEGTTVRLRIPMLRS